MEDQEQRNSQAVAVPKNYSSPQGSHVKNVVQMALMPPRFKDQELLHQSRVENHWAKTSRMLEKMGFIKKQKYDRLLLEDLGLVGLIGEDGDNGDD